MLREQILAAAGDILAREGSEQAVTLRSVAREIGIAAPSIYAHFANREAIVDAAVDAAFDDLLDRVSHPFADADEDTNIVDPAERLVGGCMAYARFALDEPGRYRILFGRSRLAPAEPGSEPQRLAAFAALVEALTECVNAGRSRSTNPFADAIEIWSGLHGAVTLRVSSPDFPWPPVEKSVREIVHRLGLIRPLR